MYWYAARAFSRTRTQHRGTRARTRTRSQVDRHRVIRGQRLDRLSASLRVRARTIVQK